MFKKFTYLFQHNYTRNFFLSCLMVFFFILLGFHLFTYFHSMHYQNTENIQHLKNYGQTSAEMIENYLSGKAASLRMLSHDQNIHSFLEFEKNSPSPKTNKYFQSASVSLNTILEADSSIQAAWLVSDAGNYYVSNGAQTSSNGYDMKTRPWYPSLVASAVDDAIWVSGSLNSLITGKNSLLMVTPVSENKHIIGYTGIEITMDSFAEKLEQMEFPPGVYPLIFSGEGEIIYRNQSSLFEAEFPLSSETMSDFLKSSLRNDRELEVFPRPGYSSYIYNQRSALTQWQIYICFDGQEFFREQHPFFLKNMLGFFVFLFLTAIGVILLFAIAFKDFPLLLSAAKEYRKENYTPKIHSTATDEIREIADCMDYLSEAVKIKNQAIENHTYFDALTKLPNREKLYTYIEDYTKHANQFSGKFALVFISIDNFKWVNDTLGHYFGDEFLIQFAKILQKCTEQYGTLSRFSGDEFVFLFNFAENVADVNQVIQKIRAVFLKPVPVFNENMHVKFSIGVSVYPDDDRTPELLLRDADIAVNLAKENEFSGIEFYNDTLHQTIACKAMISQKLVNALNNGELYLNYQPIVSTSSKNLYGFEVLLRWTNPELGTIPPAEFIPISEETGMIIPIGTWIFETACRFYKKISHKLHRDFILSINVSPHQLLQSDYVANVRQVLEITQIKPSCIQLEITETVLITLFEAASTVLRELSDLGITIALDDFGTGYNSLNYLKHFPINCLKIDKTFVDEIHKNKKDYAIADSIIDLVHNLNITTVAEGVETVGQFDSLNKMNCDLIQGYLMSKPLNEDKVLEFISEFHYTYAAADE